MGEEVALDSAAVVAHVDLSRATDDLERERPSATVRRELRRVQPQRQERAPSAANTVATAALPSTLMGRGAPRFWTSPAAAPGFRPGRPGTLRSAKRSLGVVHLERDLHFFTDGAAGIRVEPFMSGVAGAFGRNTTLLGFAPQSLRDEEDRVAMSPCLLGSAPRLVRAHPRLLGVATQPLGLYAQ